MDITPLIEEGQQVIQSYSTGQFRINGRLHKSPVIVFTDKTKSWPLTKSPVDLTADDFSTLTDAAGDLDVVLLGCGDKAEFLPRLIKELKTRNIALEVMDTGAACRTYNVLMAEGRRVAAALIPVS